MRQAIAKRLQLSQRDSGITLIELVVAMVIIAGVLMALIATQLSAAATIVEARKRTQATAYANEAMEQLRAIPWTYISTGVHTTFNNTGQDPYVTGTALLLPGETASRTLRVGNQLLTKPRAPLFDATGSNVTRITDAALTNTQFTIRAYVTEPEVGSVNTLGLAVVVSWVTARGELQETVVESTAYRGTGCGNPDEAPYLSTCQASFDGIATSGTVITSLYATTIPDADGNSTPVTLLYPTTDEFASLSMRSASVGVSAQGRQVTNVTAAAQFGGTEKDDFDPATQPTVKNWVRGYATRDVRATDDISQTLIPTHVNTTWLTQTSGAEAAWTLSNAGTTIDFLSRSDFRRPVSATASSTTPCRSYIPVDEPCANIEMTNVSSYEEGSGYMLMTIDGTILRMSRRLSDQVPTGNPGNRDTAWIARFSDLPSTDDSTGCRVLSGAGCMSAGATRHMAKLAIAQMAVGSWKDSKAPDGLVVLEGRTGCTTGFTELVMAQRGSSQRTTNPVTSRCGQVRWWNGVNYTSTAIANDALTNPISTAAVTWNNADYTITASALVDTTGEVVVPFGADANCAKEACGVRAQTGTIEITVTYDITGPGFAYRVVSTTIVEGPTVNVVYQEAPSAVSS